MLYSNLKKNAKKDAANDKIQTYKTGGGKKTTTLDTTTEKVLAVLGPKVVPLMNLFDSDAGYHDEVNTEDSFGNLDSLSANAIETDNISQAVEIAEVIAGAEGTEGTLELVVQPGSSQQVMPFHFTKTHVNQETATPPAVGNSKNWSTCWNTRRRPLLPKGTLTEKKVDAVKNVGEVAMSKKRYYDRLLELAEEEHRYKIQVLEAKAVYYSRISKIEQSID